MKIANGVFVLVAAALGTLALPTQAAKSEGSATARQGVVRCGGNHFLRLGGTEVHFTSYSVRNFDSANGITINRMRLFDGPGNVLFDSNFSSLPPSDSGLLGPTNNVLGPNQSVLFDSSGMAPFLPESNRPLQLEIEWSASKNVLTLDAVTVRISRRRDPATGAILEERGRHAIDCRSIFLK